MKLSDLLKPSLTPKPIQKASWGRQVLGMYEGRWEDKPRRHERWWNFVSRGKREGPGWPCVAASEVKLAELPFRAPRLHQGPCLTTRGPAVCSDKLSSSSAAPLQTFCFCWAPFWFPTLAFAVPPPERHPLFSPPTQILPVPSWPAGNFGSSGKAFSDLCCSCSLSSELQFSWLLAEGSWAPF